MADGSGGARKAGTCRWRQGTLLFGVRRQPGGRGALIKASIGLPDQQRRRDAKAKAEPSWRVWGLDGQVGKLETLREADAATEANDGAPGRDGVTFDVIEATGVAEVLQQRRDARVARTSRPVRGRRQAIPKDKGRTGRVLSIPAIRDRVGQGALKGRLAPIVEAAFQPGS